MSSQVIQNVMFVEKVLRKLSDDEVHLVLITSIRFA